MRSKHNTSIRINQTNRHHHQLDTGWAWVILVASFMINVLCAGVFSSFGVFLVVWQEQLSGSVTKLQWSLSLVIGIPMITGTISPTLVKHVVIREQKKKNRGKGYFFTHRRGPFGSRLG